MNFEYLSDIADTLANNPKAKTAVKTGLPIPDELRGIQRDYAYLGGGYDTPAERLRFSRQRQDIDSSSSRGFDNGTSPRSLLNPAPMVSDALGPFGTGEQFLSGSASSSRPLYESRSFVTPPADAASSAPGNDRRVLRSLAVGRPGASVFDTGAPAVPFVLQNDITSPDHADSFNDRFGNWPSVSPAKPPQTDPSKVRVLSSRAGAPDGSPLQPNIPSQAPQQSDRPLGIFTSQPTPDYPVPPPIFGLPDRSAASGDDMDDWFARWIKPLIRQ